MTSSIPARSTMTGGTGRDHSHGDGLLGDLDRVQRRSLAQVVGHQPQGQAVLGRRVVAYAASIRLVLSRDPMRSRVQLRVRVVLDDHTRRGGEEGARLIRGDLLRSLEENGLSMSNRHWNANACRGDAQLRHVEDLPSLVDDLDLFLVVALRLRPPATRHDVVRQLVWVDDRLRSGAPRDRLRLLLELVDKRPTGA